MRQGGRRERTKARTHSSVAAPRRVQAAGGPRGASARSPRAQAERVEISPVRFPDAYDPQRITRWT